MRGHQLNIYRERLEAERAVLLRDMSESRAAGEASEQSLMEQSRQLWIVETALQEIENGSYGKCLLCQRAISSKRLAEMPWSAHCASCRKLAEVYVHRPLLPAD